MIESRDVTFFEKTVTRSEKENDTQTSNLATKRVDIFAKNEYNPTISEKDS